MDKINKPSYVGITWTWSDEFLDDFTTQQFWETAKGSFAQVLHWHCTTKVQKPPGSLVVNQPSPSSSHMASMIFSWLGQSANVTEIL